MFFAWRSKRRVVDDSGRWYWCAQSVVQTPLWWCKRTFTDTSSAYDHILSRPPSDLLLMCIKIKEEKHDILLLLCLVLVANENRCRVTRFILEYQISIKKIFFFVSTSFICDVIAFRIELLKRILYFDIFLPSFFISILISFRSILTSPNENIGLRALVGLAVDKDNFVLCVHEPFEVKSLLLLCVLPERRMKIHEYRMLHEAYQM